MPFHDVHKLPQTRSQWRITAQAAAGLLAIDDLRLFGLLTGGPSIDRDRCEEILTLAAAQDIVIGDDETKRAALDLIAGFNTEAHDA